MTTNSRSDAGQDAGASSDHGSAARTPARLATLDVARFLGIFLMYYGHVVEQVMYRGSAQALQQYKFIYSFHMPLFFVLSGVIAKDWGSELGAVDFLKSRLASRGVPLLVFSLILGLISLVITPDFPPIPLRTAADYGHAVCLTLTRLPVFDIPTWFLMCLVCVEVLHALVYRVLRASDRRIGVAIVGFYLAGYGLNSRWDALADGANVWFWNEAITMYAFYLVGVWIARRRVLTLLVARPALFVATLAAIAAVYVTYDLNQGPFRLKIPAVVILAAAHGQIVWFPVTALAGTAAILLLAASAESWRPLAFMGRNALVLFCLNGLFYHHVNAGLARWFVDAWPQSYGSLCVFAAGLSTTSLLIAAPLMAGFDRFLPQLVGRPALVGPVLPALLRTRSVGVPKPLSRPQASAAPPAPRSPEVC